ncbi:argininosuccinate lyase [Candidatus Saccharibacteria bacterium]|nr:argininosuccinate lyase [Candidatus Saccharibacteria bacterium]
MTKLWQAGLDSLLPAIEHYTIGDDQTLDTELLGYDITATKAHVSMLQSINILSQDETTQVLDELNNLLKQWQEGSFVVGSEYEDGHTAIELYLTRQLGDIGKKVHTGRSRNDQALVMMRLFLKDYLEQIDDSLANLADIFKEKSSAAGTQAMPGYTHSQKAMPTTVAMWLDSYGQAFEDQLSYVKATLTIIDQNPLGSAAGFGVCLPLDREMTTKQLNFNKTQVNPIYCGLSRGLFEMVSVQSLLPTMTLVGKFTNDILSYTSQEFNYFKLPRNMTTGSSIMPHKQNYDVFEIARAYSHEFPSHLLSLQNISGSVGSGYHRDLQLTKGIVVRALKKVVSTLDILALCVSELQINKQSLDSAMTKELLTVNKIEQLIKKGVPFRDAYHKVKLNC